MEETTERMDPKPITATVVVIEEGKDADDSLLGISISIFISKRPSNPVEGCKFCNARPRIGAVYDNETLPVHNQL